MGIYERGGGEGSRMMAGLCRSRSMPSGVDGPRGAPVEDCSGVRQGDLVLASMAAEYAVGLDMQSPDSRSGMASTRD